MLVPQSLKKTEQNIKEELASANVKAHFEIRNYELDNNIIQYVLDVPPQEVPRKAKEIVEKHLNKWKSIYTNAKL